MNSLLLGVQLYEPSLPLLVVTDAVKLILVDCRMFRKVQHECIRDPERGEGFIHKKSVACTDVVFHTQQNMPLTPQHQFANVKKTTHNP
jgi:hypothetical protein